MYTLICDTLLRKARFVAQTEISAMAGRGSWQCSAESHAISLEGDVGLKMGLLHWSVTPTNGLGLVGYSPTGERLADVPQSQRQYSAMYYYVSTPYIVTISGHARKLGPLQVITVIHARDGTILRGRSYSFYISVRAARMLSRRICLVSSAAQVPCQECEVVHK